MLFVSQPPVQVEIEPDRKVIVLTSNKIIFTHLDFIEEYLSMPLITHHPRRLHYEPSVMQAMVISDTTVEVFYCDWKTQIKLLRVIILNDESVEAACYDRDSGWHIFGSMRQYEPTRISFHVADDEGRTGILAKCYAHKNKYLLTQDKLEKSDGGEGLRQVAWKDRMMVLKNCQYQVKMQASSTLDKTRDILCINQSYVLILANYQVLATVVEPMVAYIKNSLLISYVDEGKYTAVQKYETNNFVEIGTINREQGTLEGSFLYEDDLVLLHYDSREIKVANLPLTEPEEPVLTNKKPSRRKRLFQSISKIMEESHEDGSQLFQKDESSSKIYINSRPEGDYRSISRPIVRDIMVNDEEIRDDSLNEGNSEVLSRSGIDEVYQDKQIINDEAKQQMSFELALPRKNSLHQRTRNPKEVLSPQRISARKRGSLQGADVSLGENVLKSTQLPNDISLNSDISDKIKSNSKAPGSKSRQDLQNTSNLSDLPETPQFSQIGGGFGEKCAAADKMWEGDNFIHEENQEDVQQSICMKDKQKSVLNFVPEQYSLKVETFKPFGIMTSQIYNKIQRSSYYELINRAVAEDPDKLYEYTRMFIREILDEPQAPLFFSNNIKTFSPQLTQEKIRKLLGDSIDNPELKTKITSALQLFKLEEVPKQALCFPQDFIKVMLVLYKNIYIEDLLKPNQGLIQSLLQSYFSIKSFPQQIVTIEDEEIDISHPRNMLNILLYLNEFLQLKLETVIKVYCARLLAQNHLEILDKITTKENIFEICDVPRSVLDEVIIKRFNQLLDESVENADYLWNIIEFLSEDRMNEYRIMLAIITEFNRWSIAFDLPLFIRVSKGNSDLFGFLQKIIVENSWRNLANLKFEGIYKSIYWLQQKHNTNYMTNEYVSLIKILCEKFCEKKMFYYGFKVLDSVLPKVKTSFVAKQLYLYIGSRFIDRLSGYSCHHIDKLKDVFPELMGNPQIEIQSLPPEKLKIPEYSKCFSCSWSKFNSIFDKYLQGPLPLKVLSFSQINIAHQMFLLVQQKEKRRFTSFLAEVKQYLRVEIEEQLNSQDAEDPKALTSVKFETLPKNQFQSQIATSTMNREDLLLLQQDHETGKKKIHKSMTLIDHFNEVSSSRLPRRNSDERHREPAFVGENYQLMRVGLLVDRNEIIEQLREIYERQSQEEFLQALVRVDRQRMSLFYLDIYKAIACKQLQFPLHRILPFEIFVTSDQHEAFLQAKPFIMTELNIRNFWVIYTIAEHMFRKGDEVAKLFIHKSITYFRNDQYSQLIDYIAAVACPRIDPEFLAEMIGNARDYGLHELAASVEAMRRL